LGVHRVVVDGKTGWFPLTVPGLVTHGVTSVCNLERGCSLHFLRGFHGNDRSDTLICLSPAKINLFLSMTGRRPDGYHELASLMACIDLYDRIVLTYTGRDIRLACNAPGVPADESNLAYRAAAAVPKCLSRAQRASPLCRPCDPTP
jgi:hypothetical protein